MTSRVHIRPATETDVPAITSIYRHHVLTGTATFEIDPPSVDEMLVRKGNIESKGLPYLVAERDGAVSGYAYAGPYRPREAYRFTAEDSIYIHPDYQRQGLGRLLLREVIEECKRAGLRQIIAVIGDSANTGSIRLHESFQFRHVGVLRCVGFKFERWLDTVLMQLPLHV
jgi:phosphinothricin acetyltransferase